MGFVHGIWVSKEQYHLQRQLLIFLAIRPFLRLTRNGIPYYDLHTIKWIFPPGLTTLGVRDDCSSVISALFAIQNISTLSPMQSELRVQLIFLFGNKINVMLYVIISFVIRGLLLNWVK